MNIRAVAVSIEGTNRAGLRQLFHYGARSSVNLSILSFVTPEDPDQGSSELAQLDRARASSEEKMERRHGVFNLHKTSRRNIITGKWPSDEVCGNPYRPSPDGMDGYILQTCQL